MLSNESCSITFHKYPVAYFVCHGIIHQGLLVILIFNIFLFRCMGKMLILLNWNFLNAFALRMSPKNRIGRWWHVVRLFACRVYTLTDISISECACLCVCVCVVCMLIRSFSVPFSIKSTYLFELCLCYHAYVTSGSHIIFKSTHNIMDGVCMSLSHFLQCQLSCPAYTTGPASYCVPKRYKAFSLCSTFDA